MELMMDLERLLRRAPGEDGGSGYLTAELVKQAYAMGFCDAASGEFQQLPDSDPAWEAIES
jgi:hypothetical protein